MTTVDAHAPTISIRERYRDVVSDRWPGVIAPQPDELLSSWLHRLAYANGVAPRAFARVLGLNPGMWSAALDVRLPNDIADLLSAKTGIAPIHLSSMMLLHGLPNKLLLPLRNGPRYESSTWLQFCSQCLAADAQPYFRRRWRLASRISCTKHGCRLRDRCPSCRSRVAAFNQAELVPQHHCALCSFDLRHAPSLRMTPEMRTFDRCIDDMCSVEAFTEIPSGPVLLRRLLDIPSVGGPYSTMILTSLSTAARTRCIQHLTASSELPVTVQELLEEDELTSRRLRRLIPLTSDAHAWIAPLASALGGKRGRPSASTGNEPSTTLRELLRAYARISPGSAIDVRPDHRDRPNR